MSDKTYTEALDAAHRRLTRGEADRLIHDAYLDGRTSAEEYIAYLREELHDAWGRIWALEQPDEHAAFLLQLEAEYPEVQQ
jgi:hypothetical protein